jgi:threonine dehydrogenase-like Zn-dependent dehydrogenase
MENRWRSAVAVTLAFVVLVAGCGSAGFASGKIIDDVGDSRSWTAAIDESEACVVIDSGATSCVSLTSGGQPGGLDLRLGVEDGSTAIVGLAPSDTTAVRVVFHNSAFEALSVASTPAGRIVFAGAVGFSQASVPVTFEARDDSGSLLGSVDAELTEPFPR